MPNLNFEQLFQSQLYLEGSVAYIAEQNSVTNQIRKDIMSERQHMLP